MPLTGHSLNPPIGSKTCFGSSDPQRALQEQLSSQREGLCRRRLQPKTEEVWWFGQTVGLHMKNESQTCKIICIYLGGGFKYFYFPYLGKSSNLTNIFGMGWNHQPDILQPEKSNNTPQPQPEKWYVGNIAYDILELSLQLHVSHQVLAEKSSGHTGVGQMLQFV